VVVLAVGSGLGLYLASRAHPPARNVAAAPSAHPIGAQSVAQSQQAVILTVVKTSPSDSATDIPLNASITLGFNLAITPAAVKSFLSVQATDSGQPNVAGTLSQGTAPQQVVFRPSSTFDFGTSVNVSLRNGIQSRDGTKLNNDFNFSFTTILQPKSVDFGARLVSAQSGRPVKLDIQVGAEMGTGSPALTIKTYKATASDLLAALVYSSKDGQYLDKPIDTTSMHLMDTAGTSLKASGARVNNVEAADSVTISEPVGIYLVLAMDGNRQAGFGWVDFSRYAVLLRQDDQKIVVAGEDLISGAPTPKFEIAFYNLMNAVHPKLSGSFAGAAEFPARFPAGLDIAIATSGGEEVVVPISVPTAGAFIGVSADLSKHPQIFLTTDRPAYKQGEVVKFGGAVRVSNDQSYTVGGGGKVEVWTGGSNTSLAVATVAPDGTFSGSFTIPAGAFNSDGTDGQLSVFASALGANHSDPNLLTTSASIVALAAHAPTSVITVKLDKVSYVASDSVVASITAVNAKGQPLAGQTVNLTVYAAQHTVQPVEMDSFPSPTTWGEPVLENVKVRLDATGQAKYSMKVSAALKAVDQEITVAVTNGTGKSMAVGAGTAIVYQATDEVFLLDSRFSHQTGDAYSVVAHFVVESRGGARVAGLPMAYELDKTDYQGDQTTTTVAVAGTVTTDSNGLGTIRTTYTGPPASMVLRIAGKDPSGNVFEDDGELDFEPGSSDSNFGMTADKIAYNVGDTANLTVTAGSAVGGLLSFERGRVHQYKWLQLTKGDNQLAVSITPDLAPGFTVVFSYFLNGVYSSNEFAVYVNNSGRLLKVAAAADQPTYAKGQTAHLTVAVTDNAGAPVAATLLADGYDARMSAYKLVDQVSIAGAFLTPSPLSTNGTSSLVGIGNFGGGRCGGGPNVVLGSPYAGRTAVWLTDLSTDSTGHATIDVPIVQSGPIRLVVMAGSATSSWGQAEVDLNVP
jgi:Bacterial Ig-like domain/Alpha-2-macroglobulin bait region domain